MLETVRNPPPSLWGTHGQPPVPYQAHTFVRPNEGCLTKSIAQETLHEAATEVVAAASETGAAFLPVIRKLKLLIESDVELCEAFRQMFQQNPSGSEAMEYMAMLGLFNSIIQEAPRYPNSVPIWSVIQHAVNTHAGQLAFNNKRVKEHFHEMFTVWSAFLTSPPSCHVLSSHEDGGWFTSDARAVMEENYGGLRFEEIFECDPDAPHWGFQSWDHFFTRELRQGIRPVECADDDSVINVACESEVYGICEDVKVHDSFWVKGEPYSVGDLLNHDELSLGFEGGTVFQGYLSATNYHRYCSPVAGTIKKIVHVSGAHCAQSPATIQIPSDTPGQPGYLRSLAYVAHTNTRVIIFIESRNPNIGLMAFVAVGMSEVSTCEATVKVGDIVVKGQSLGSFHFGGSTHCLVFTKKANVEFLEAYRKRGAVAPVRGALAVARG